MDILRFIIGAAVGSFINVLVLRYDPDRALVTKDILVGRSHCPSCKKTLRWFELIPLVSFLLQDGRCRQCKSRLTLQYPLIEILCGIIFVVVPYAPHGLFDPSWLSIALWTAVLSLFLLVAIIDFRQSVIPNGATILLALIGVADIIFLFRAHVIDFSLLGYYSSILGFRDSLILNRFAGVAVGLFVFGAIYVFSRGRGMGMGDVKLIGALGILFGWPEIVLIMMLSFITGALANAPALLHGSKGMKDAVPFGPFIVFSAAMVFFFGYEIIRWYFKIFGIA